MTKFHLAEYAPLAHYAKPHRLVMEDDATPVTEELELCELVNTNVQAENKQIEAVANLQAIAAEIAQGKGQNLAEALSAARQIEQNLETSLNEIKKKTAFTVQAIDSRGESVARHDGKFAEDIRMHAQDVPISDDKLDFKIEIDRTLTVIKVVFDIAYNGWDRLQNAIWWGQSSARQERARKRSNYILDLAGICHVGLQHNEPTQVKLARRSLDSFRDEFVAREAKSVKNRYLRRLGVRCLLVAVLTAAGYYVARNSCDQLNAACQASVLYSSRNFWLLICGSAVGAWLSFALRKVILTFLDLAAIEEDNLDPAIRVLFVTGLTTVVGLLFWTEAATVGIGKFSSSLASHGTYALLAGLLLGIAERTMATSVLKRATDFAGGVGGK